MSSQAAGDAQGEERRVVVGDGPAAATAAEATTNGVMAADRGRSVLIDIVLTTGITEKLTGCPQRITCRYSTVQYSTILLHHPSVTDRPSRPAKHNRRG